MLGVWSGPAPQLRATIDGDGALVEQLNGSMRGSLNPVAEARTESLLALNSSLDDQGDITIVAVIARTFIWSDLGLLVSKT